MKKINLNDAVCVGAASPQARLVQALVSGKKLPEEYASDKTGVPADRLFVCEGDWAAEKLIEKGIRVILFLFCPDRLKEGERKNAEAMASYADEFCSVSEKTCARISDRDGADSSFTVAVMPEWKLSDLKLSENMTAIILDGQEQPGNIGAILRSLDAAGGDFAVYTNRRCKMTHPRLVRSSLGAAFMMPFVEAEFGELTSWLEKNGFKAVVTDLTATKSYFDEDYSGRVAIVAGNEYKGISPGWRGLDIARPVIIPMLGSVESLNVGFASTLVAYECSMRQKGIIKRNAE